MAANDSEQKHSESNVHKLTVHILLIGRRKDFQRFRNTNFKFKWCSVLSGCKDAYVSPLLNNRDEC